MSQEIQVLQCFSCNTFQSQIVKKSFKWVCKMCGEKQSRKKVFGQGSGKDCRVHVQRLNELQKKKELGTCNGMGLNTVSLPLPEKEKIIEDSQLPGSSKWSKYLTPPKNDSDSDDNEYDISCHQITSISSTESFPKPPVKKQKLDVEQYTSEFDNCVNSYSISETSEAEHLSFKSRNNPQHSLYTSREPGSGNCSTIDTGCHKQESRQDPRRTNFDLYSLVDFGFSQEVRSSCDSPQQDTNLEDLDQSSLRNKDEPLSSDFELSEVSQEVRNGFSQEVRSSCDLPQQDTNLEDLEQSSLRIEDEQLSSDFELSQVSQEVRNGSELFRWDTGASDLCLATTTVHTEDSGQSSVRYCMQEFEANNSDYFPQDYDIVANEGTDGILNEKEVTHCHLDKTSQLESSGKTFSEEAELNRTTNLANRIETLNGEVQLNEIGVVAEDNMQLHTHSGSHNAFCSMKVTNTMHSKPIFSAFDRTEDDYNDDELDAVLSF